MSSKIMPVAGTVGKRRPKRPYGKRSDTVSSKFMRLSKDPAAAYKVQEQELSYSHGDYMPC